MKLPAGATGFDTPANPNADLRSFLTVCHQVARQLGGTITRTTPAGVTPNFHTAVIQYTDGQQIAVLRHAVLPLVAFAHPRSGGDTTMTFIDHPSLAATIRDICDLRVLTTDQLHTPLSHVDLSALTGHEHDQINYWKPETVGDLLFNYWD